MPLETTDRTVHVKAAIRESIRDALEEIGARAEGYAKGNVHVVSGRLRDSIGHEGNDTEEIVYAETPYAADEELGNSHQDAHPYLRPSVVDHMDEFVSIFKDKASSIS